MPPLVSCVRARLAARPWWPWMAPLGFAGTLLCLRAALAALRWLLPFAPNLLGLLTLITVSAMYTAPLFQWPARIPVPVLGVCALHALFLTQYVAVFNLTALCAAPAIALGAVNLFLLIRIAGEVTAEIHRPGFRMVLFRMYTGWLPAALLPQILLLVAVALLGAGPDLPAGY